MADPWRAAGNAPRSRCEEGGDLVNLEVEVGKREDMKAGSVS